MKTNKINFIKEIEKSQKKIKYYEKMHSYLLKKQLETGIIINNTNRTPQQIENDIQFEKLKNEYKSLKEKYGYLFAENK